MVYTLKEFLKQYPNDAKCLDKVFQLRYGSLEIECPCCKKETKFRRIMTRRSYQCRLCYHQVYPTAGTPFAKTRTPLNYWFYVMYLMTTTRNGVASKEVERALGVTYKTAHLMTTQVRKLMQQYNYQKKLSGHVEMDETYVSTGKAKGVEVGRGAKNKKPVFAMVERLGEVRAQAMENVTTKNINPVILKNVDKNAQVSTDEFAIYTNLHKLGFVDHTVIKHKLEKYRDGVTSTNTIEGFFSQLKRMIHGTHIHVSDQHLDKYVAEAVFRYNHRFKDVDMFGCLLLKITDYQGQKE